MALSKGKIQVCTFFIVFSAGILIILSKLIFTPVRTITKWEPGLDGAPLKTESLTDDVTIGSYFELININSAKTEDTGRWESFRGSDRTNIINTATPLTTTLSPDRILWSIEVGEGHAGVSISSGIVYLLDYNENLKKEYLVSFDLYTGDELWRRGYNLDIKRNHGFSRSVPAVNDQYVLTIGVEGHVMCVDKFTGDLIWGIDMAKEYGAKTPGWYASQCPYITDRGTVILAPSGNILLTEIDLATGEVLFETENITNYSLSHSSVMPMEFFGHKMYVYSSIGGVSGISAEDDSRGELLWSQDWYPAVVAPSPLKISESSIYLTAGYGSGSRIFNLEESNGVWTTVVSSDKRADEGIACEQQTPILYKNRLYSIMPKDARSLREQFVYSDLDGEIIKTAGNEFTFGLGPFILANGNFYVLKDSGELYIIEPEELKVLDRLQIFDGHDAWGPIAISGKYMVLRDSTTIKCLDMGVNSEN